MKYGIVQQSIEKRSFAKRSLVKLHPIIVQNTTAEQSEAMWSTVKSDIVLRCQKQLSEVRLSKVYFNQNEYESSRSNQVIKAAETGA